MEALTTSCRRNKQEDALMADFSVFQTAVNGPPAVSTSRSSTTKTAAGHNPLWLRI
jgi:hypothetical protein